MAVLDIDSVVEKVINGTDEKLIQNRYNMMKENYTEESAKDFFESYNDKPLSTILEMSRLIFSEPMYGYDFYKEAVVNTNYCQFLALEKERDKIEEYLETAGNKLPENQKKMYTSLLESVEKLVNDTKHIRIIAESIEDKCPGISNKISDAIYNENATAFLEATGYDDGISHVYEMVIEAYLPYLSNHASKQMINSISSSFVTEMLSASEEADEFRPYVSAIVAGNKAKLDSGYAVALEHVDRDLRYVISHVANQDLSKIYQEMVSSVEESIHHADVSSAIDDIAFDAKEAAAFEYLYKDERKRNKDLLGIINEATMFVLEHDYGETYDKSGYSILNNSDYTYEEAIIHIGEDSDFFVEAGNSDDDDESVLDEFEDDGSDKSEKKSTSKKTTTTPVTAKETSPQDKPKKDQVKAVENKPDLVTRIQNKAMDSEVKQMKTFGKIKRDASKLRNAAKAVTNVPKNIIDSIKDISKKLDAADDERRKKYMTEPGFRKKIFRNMKLSLLYTTALNVRLSLLPVLLLSRHASKQKDKRIRNECYRELMTEIKLCDEKINDANSAGDNAEKYRLMRIKDQLEAEAVRVRVNSRYI